MCSLNKNPLFVLHFSSAQFFWKLSFCWRCYTTTTRVLHTTRCRWEGISRTWFFYATPTCIWSTHFFLHCIQTKFIGFLDLWTYLDRTLVCCFKVFHFSFLNFPPIFVHSFQFRKMFFAKNFKTNDFCGIWSNSTRKLFGEEFIRPKLFPPKVYPASS